LCRKREKSKEREIRKNMMQRRRQEKRKDENMKRVK
jgi:hypothetical protein